MKKRRGARKKNRPAKAARETAKLYKKIITEYKENGFINQANTKTDNTENNKHKKCIKKKIKSKRQAKTTLSLVRRRGREEIRFYWCRICKAYHLTSRKRKLIWENEDNTQNQEILIF